jgi:hypothetical protein
LNGLYRDLLGRVPDAAGLNGCLGALARGVSHPEVAADIAGSGEREGRVITRDYTQILSRAPEPGAVTGWLTFLTRGNDRLDVET